VTFSGSFLSSHEGLTRTPCGHERTVRCSLNIARKWGNHLHNLLLTSFAAASTLTSYAAGRWSAPRGPFNFNSGYRDVRRGFHRSTKDSSGKRLQPTNKVHRILLSIPRWSLRWASAAKFPNHSLHISWKGPRCFSWVGYTCPRHWERPQKPSAVFRC
jgi:hypothetical protein